MFSWLERHCISFFLQGIPYFVMAMVVTLDGLRQLVHRKQCAL